MNRTPKDIQIMVMALLKSVIESGAPMDKWQQMVRAALNLHLGFVDQANKKLLGNKDNSNG